MQKKIKKQGLEILHDLSIAIASAPAVEKIYERILDEAISAIGVEKASIMKYDPQIKKLRVVAARGMDKITMRQVRVKVGEGISGRVFKSKEPLLVKNIRTSKSVSKRTKYKSSSLISAPVVCLPLKMGGKPIGVINMTDKVNGKPFTGDDLKLLATITNQAAAYIHVCDLAEKVRDAEKAERELEIARQIHDTLMPKTLPKVKGFDIAGRCMNAEKIGGDYFDVIKNNKKGCTMVVADVSGHSVGAALLMSGFRSSFRAACEKIRKPSKLTKKLNCLLYDDLVSAEQFISIIVADCDVKKRSVHLTNAGHPPPLVWRGLQKTFEKISTDGSLLGIEKKADFKEKCVRLQRGDLMVIYTDGLTELANDKGERFGVGRLEKVILGCVKKPAKPIVDAICKAALKFNKSVMDDITILAIKAV
jgi:serine phosphatase RsbU (regulator of sigma subunit)